MMDPSDSRLIRAYADGEIEPEGFAELEQRLKQEPGFREKFLSELAIVATIEDLAVAPPSTAVAREDAGSNPPQTLAKVQPWARTVSRPALQIAFALVLLLLLGLAVGALFSRPETSADIVTIVSVNGEVTWTGDGGRVFDDIRAGQDLPGGTFELLTTDAWVELEFSDGTRLALSGHSNAIVSEEKQKNIHLRSGSLSASVREQPDGRPLLVHTSAADIEVLGTRFTVDSRDDQTKLVVREGRVRFTRSTDGASLVVPAHHQVVTSIGDFEDLKFALREKRQQQWSSHLEHDVLYGQWVSNLDLIGRKLKLAVASGELDAATAKQRFQDAATLGEDEGRLYSKPSKLGSLLLVSVDSGSSFAIIADEDAYLVMRGHLSHAVELYLGFSASLANGGMVGKYGVRVPASDPRIQDGEFELRIPLSEFQGLGDRQDDTMNGKELVDFWCQASDSMIKLEVKQIELRVFEE